MRVFLRYPGGAERDTVGTINGDGSVSFVVTLNPNAASGDYLIERFIITDLAGNNITYSNQDLVNAGFNNRWTLDNDISDDQAPKILSLSLNAVNAFAILKQSLDHPRSFTSCSGTSNLL